MPKALSTLVVGDKIKFGSYRVEGSPAQPITWVVAEQNHAGYPGSSTTLVAENIIDFRGFDANEPGNANSGRATNGNNRYSTSNIRQWLNSSGAANAWWVAQNISTGVVNVNNHDAAPANAGFTQPTGYADTPGFLTNFTSVELAKILTTVLTTALNTVTDGGLSETVSDKVFLLSVTELGLGNTNSIAEGSTVAWFTTAANKIATATSQAITSTLSASKPVDVVTAWQWWLRSPDMSSDYACRARADGLKGITPSHDGDQGIRPAMNLDSTFIINDAPDAQGYYTRYVAPPGTIRYVRDYTNGHSVGTGNHWTEIQVIDATGTNVALNKTVTHNGTFDPASPKPIAVIVDGDTNSDNHVDFYSGPMYVQIDLGNSYDIRSIKIWHYYWDNRIYNNTKTLISEDGVDWFVVFDSAITGTYAESSVGHIIPVNAGPSGNVFVSEYSLTSHLSQPTDGIGISGSKWFSLQENVLDGTYHPIEVASQVGWWGNTLSDINGVLASKPQLIVPYRGGQYTSTVSIYGDSQLNEYPVDFTVALYFQDQLLELHTVIGNTDPSYFAELTGGVHFITSAVYTITKINKASRTVKVLDITSSVTTLVGSDDLVIGITNVSLQSYGIYGQDNLYIQQTIEHEEFTANIQRPDDLIITLEESSKVENIYAAMDADLRQTFGKVEITYTDPFNDEQLNISATETAYGTNVQELADNILTPQYKMFSLHENKLDGSYHPLPALDDKVNSVGWWGTHLSDINGILPVIPKITISFASRALLTLRVAGDPKLNNFPVDFILTAYNASNAAVLTRNIVGNTEVVWQENITPLFGVTKIDLTVSKINKPNSTVKLTELFTAIVEEYYNDEIESIHIFEEIGYVSGGLPIGNLSANEADIVLSNADRRFDLNNQNSKLYGYIKRNRRVRTWLGAKIAGEIEWHPMGTFWTTQWDMSHDSLVATLTARDRLELLRLTDFKTSLVYSNYTLLQLFELILNDAGVIPANYELDPQLNDIVVPYAWFEVMSHREALQRLAACAVIQVYCTKHDTIKVNLHWDATPTPMATFHENVNIFRTKRPLAVSEQVNYAEVISKQWAPDTLQQVFSSDEALAVPANSNVTLTYKFSNIPVINAAIPVITGSGVTVLSRTAYAWGMEVTLRNNTSASVNVTKVTIDGQPLKASGKQSLIAQDAALIRQDGKVKAQAVEHDFIQSATYAKSLADTLLLTYKSSRYDVTLENRGNIALQLGDQVLVNDPQAGVDESYLLTRQDINWNGYLEATSECKKL